MPKPKAKLEDLEQYDFIEPSAILHASNRYAKAIGEYLIEFSSLEHAVNVSISDFMYDGGHYWGYLVIERLQMNPKIELLKKILTGFVTNTGLKAKHRAALKELMGRLKEANEFRNKVAHANWYTLTKDGYVRTKIVVDSDDGNVKFQKIRIMPKDIRVAAQEAVELGDDLYQFVDLLPQDAYASS